MRRRKDLVPLAEQKLTRREEIYVKILVSEDGLVTRMSVLPNSVFYHASLTAMANSVSLSGKGLSAIQ